MQPPNQNFQLAKMQMLRLWPTWSAHPYYISSTIICWPLAAKFPLPQKMETANK